MNKILIAICASLFILSGMNSFATPEADNTNHISETISFSMPTLSKTEQTTFVQIDSIETQLIEPGKPVLPSYEKTYTFPFGTSIKDISCEVYNSQFITVEETIEYTPMPTIGGIQTTASTKKDIASTVYPDNWYDYDIGTGLDGLQRKVFLKLSVHPVRYHPETEQLEYIDNVDIDIRFTPPTVDTFNLDETYQLLILTAPEFSSEISPLVNHKINTMNLTTKLVSTTDVYAGSYFPVEGRDNPEKIKYFIKNAIEEWDTKYVLFVGGAEYFPTRETHVYVNYNDGDDEIFVTDLYFADIYDETFNFSSWDTNGNNVFGEYDWNGNYDDVDLYPDVHFGRIAAETKEIVTGMVNKIITYETNEAWTQDWFNTMVVIGGDTSPSDDSNIDEGEYVNQVCLDYMDGFIPDKIWGSNGRLGGLSPTGVENINNGFANGCGFLDWAGHGAPTVWTTYPHNGTRQSLPSPWGSYYAYQAMDLENGDKLPIVVTGACSVAKFDQVPDCFTWSFVKNPDGGGIGAYGASGLSWGYSGTYTIRGLGGKVHVGYYKAYSEGAYTFGELHTGSLNDYIGSNLDGGAHKSIEQWTPFGDPSLMIRGESQPPAKPELSGPASGKINTEHTYTATATDPDNDELSYLFDWGDETYSEWLGPVQSGDEIEATHIWEEQGDYSVRVKVKDERGVQSEWSDPLPVTMPYQRHLTLSDIFEMIREDFPFLFSLFQSFIS